MSENKWTPISEYKEYAEHSVWVNAPERYSRVVPGWYQPGKPGHVLTSHGAFAADEDTVSIMLRDATIRPDPPEPEKPLLQKACETLGIKPWQMNWGRCEEDTDYAHMVRDSLLWRIECNLQTGGWRQWSYPECGNRPEVWGIGKDGTDVLFLGHGCRSKATLEALGQAMEAGALDD